MGTYFSITFNPLEGVPDASSEVSTLIGPGMCMLFSAISIPLYMFFIYVRDVRSYTSPRKVVSNFTIQSKMAADGGTSDGVPLNAPSRSRPIDWKSVLACGC